jgi:undecaprenyl-diphosphatase
MFTWAALVAISRIFVGKHYLGDVIVGTLVGLIIGYTLGVIASKLYPFFTKN